MYKNQFLQVSLLLLIQVATYPVVLIGTGEDRAYTFTDALYSIKQLYILQKLNCSAGIIMATQCHLIKCTARKEWSP